MSKITLNNIATLKDATTALIAINANTNTIQTAFDNTLSRNGAVPNEMQSELDMNSNRIMNLPEPVSGSEPVRLVDLTGLTGGSGGISPYFAGAGLDLDGATHTFSVATGGVSNAMLAGSIPSSKLVGTDITVVGTLSSGTVPIARIPGLATVAISGSASDLGSGTLADARLPTSMASKTFTGTTTVSGGLAGTTATFSSTLNATGAAVFGGTVTLAADPVSALQAATKQYVDGAIDGLQIKAAVAVATTANITLSGEQTIDGVLTSTSRVLVKNQSTTADNGIYVSAAGAWARAADIDTWIEAVNAFTFVSAGTANASSGWVASVLAGGTIGVTSMPWTQFSASTSYSAGAGLALSGSVFSADTGTSGHKLSYLDAANTWSAQQTFNTSPSQALFIGTGANPGFTIQNDTNPGLDGYASYIYFNQRDLAGTLWRGGAMGPGFQGATPNALYFDWDINGYTNSIVRTLSFTGVPGYGARTATITIASPAVVTLNAHGFVANTPIKFNVYATSSGTLPTGLVAGTLYYVRATGLTANTFQVSATAGGAAINTSGSQSGTHNVVTDKLATTTFLTLDALGYSRLGAPGQGWSSVRVENAFDNTLPPEIEINDTAQAVTAGLYRLVSSGSQFQIQKNIAAAGDFSTKTSIAFPSGNHTAAMLESPSFTGTALFENFTVTDDTSGLITLGRFSSSGAGLWSLIRTSAGSNGFEFRDNPGNPIARLSTSSGIGFVDVFGTLRTGSNTFMLRTSVPLNDGTGALAATLTNSPKVGDPTKWMPYDDNGTTRYIPAW